MKQDDRLDRPRGVEQDFPGENAGASLKRINAYRLRCNFLGFPRRKCRGLIETSPAVHPVLPLRRDFPGENAGASLKRQLRERQRLAPPDDFPGENAGASLKQRLRF